VYIVANIILPADGAYISYLTAGFCAFIIGWRVSRYIWLSVALFVLLIIGFNFIMSYFIVKGNLPDLSGYNTLKYIFTKSGYVFLTSLFTIVIAAALGNILTALFRKKGFIKEDRESRLQS
jgi:hypothetical protein